MSLWDFLEAQAARREDRWERRQQESRHRFDMRQLDKAQQIAAGITWRQRFRGLTERQGVTLGVFALAVGMLMMARETPGLWDQKLFEILVQGVILTGLLSMVLGFHFSANKNDEARVEVDHARAISTAKQAEAMRAVAENVGAGISPSGEDQSETPTGAPGDPLHVVEEKPGAQS